MWFDNYDICCINLEEDLERKNSMIEKFANFQIKSNFISANRPDSQWKSTNYQYTGEFGVTLSQLKCLINYVDTSKDGVVIFEDDATFSEDMNDRVNQAISELPDDYDILYLGGAPREKLKYYSKNLCIVGDFTQAVGYIVNKKSIKDLCMYFTDRMGRLFPDACCDNIINDFIKVNGKKGYTIYPFVVEQENGWSTLRQGIREYKDMIRDEWEKFKP